jgi:hypothetical protein
MKDTNPFDGLDYTRDKLAIQWALIAEHASDGSALEAGCACIQERHLLLVEGLAAEGAQLATDKKEKDFYTWLAGFARNMRLNILDGKYDIPAQGGACNCPPCKCSEE